MKNKLLKIKKFLNTIVKGLFFFLFPAVFATAFAGLKYIFQQLAAGEGLTINAFLNTLMLVVGFTIVFGRFFCGYACAFGIYGDVMYGISSWVRKKLKKKPFFMSERLGIRLRYGKYAVLFLIIMICLFRKSEWIQMISPWNVFSRLTALQLPLENSYVGIILLVLISFGMMWEQRFFCRFLCPLGAVFSLLPVLPFSQVKRSKENCIKGCQACKKVCPAKISIEYTDGEHASGMGECFSCGKCVDICPKKNVSSSTVRRGYWGIVLIMMKAAVLIGLYILITHEF